MSQGSRHEVRLFVGGALGDQQVQLHILHICCILLHIINPIAYYVFKCIYAHISDIFTVCMHILGAWAIVALPTDTMGDAGASSATTAGRRPLLPPADDGEGGRGGRRPAAAAAVGRRPPPPSTVAI